MEQKNHAHTISYTVNDEPQSTTEKELTPIQIMTNAGVDSATNYLIELQGAHQESYKDKPNQLIKMHNNLKFITNFTGPTGVSK